MADCDNDNNDRDNDSDINDNKNEDKVIPKAWAALKTLTRVPVRF